MVNPMPNTSGLAAPFTSAVASEQGRKGGLAKKGKPRSWEETLNRELDKRLPSGETKRSAVGVALVVKALEGDVRALDLLFRVTGWRPNAATIKARVANVALTIDASTVPTPTQAVEAQAVTSHALPIPGNAIECTLSGAGQVQTTQVPMAQGDSAAGEAGAQRDNADAGAG